MTSAMAGRAIQYLFLVIGISLTYEIVCALLVFSLRGGYE
jgi:hypothetical protein